MSDEEESIQDVYDKIVARRRKRDDYYLRQGKIVATRELSAHWKEWIVQEIKDLLIISAQLQTSTDMVLRDTAADVHNRVRSHNAKVTRTIIRPLNVISNGGVKAKSEMDHMEKFEKAIKDACALIKELGNLRDTLDDALQNSKTTVKMQDYKFYG